ncbi:MAG: nucleotidyltransferase domain-containing protein [Cytophagales bacterium]
MKLEHYSSDKLKAQLSIIVRKYLSGSHYTLFFFGSRVDGTSKERSDVDIGLITATGLDNSAKYKIIEEIETIKTLYTLDFVDFFRTSTEFQKIALRNIEIIDEIT